MAQYDVSHIDIGRYRELQQLVQEGRARAVIMVEYLDANTPPLVNSCNMSENAQNRHPILSEDRG